MSTSGYTRSSGKGDVVSALADFVHSCRQPYRHLSCFKRLSRSKTYPPKNAFTTCILLELKFHRGGQDSQHSKLTCGCRRPKDPWCLRGMILIDYVDDLLEPYRVSIEPLDVSEAENKFPEGAFLTQSFFLCAASCTALILRKNQTSTNEAPLL